MVMADRRRERIAPPGACVRLHTHPREQMPRSPGWTASGWLFLLLVTVGSRALIAQNTGSITGTVIDAGNRRPIGSAQVTIVGSGSTIGAVTNAQGTYRILNVAPGTRAV